METHIVILAGGAANRLPPQHTPQGPEPFIKPARGGKSLIQRTVERFRGLCILDHIWIVTSEEYRDIARKQLPAILPYHILGEPVMRHTAPALAYACWKIKKRHPAANVVVTPTDTPVANREEFQRIIAKALLVTYRSNSMVTIGIKPGKPWTTGYGYIAAGEALDDEIWKVNQFKEKTELTTAQQCSEAENYFRNTGIFIGNAQTIETAIRRHAPQIAEVFDRIYPELYTDKEKETIENWFPACENTSLEHAVMEKVERMYVLPTELEGMSQPSARKKRPLIHIPAETECIPNFLEE